MIYHLTVHPMLERNWGLAKYVAEHLEWVVSNGVIHNYSFPVIRYAGDGIAFIDYQIQVGLGTEDSPFRWREKRIPIDAIKVLGTGKHAVSLDRTEYSFI